MESYIKNVEVRWSDLDPNFHLRHSVYYDWGAYCRMCFFMENGLTPDVLQQQQVGPILLREECQFRREIHFGDNCTIDMVVLHARQDLSRWTIQHQIKKNDHTLAAIVTIDGAWLNTKERKMTLPPEIGHQVFQKLPKHPEFGWKNK